MRVTSIDIWNFRGISELHLDLGQVTVLIGENNTGKTSVLDALRLCLRDLGPRRRVVFDALDFHLPDEGTDPSSADPIKIEILFSERTMGEWNDELLGRLNRNRILQIEGGRNQVKLRVMCSYASDEREFVQNWTFLNLAGEPMAVDARALTSLQQEVSYFYLTALRDAAHHFDARGPFWRPFLRDSQLSSSKKAEIESKLREVNELIVSSHESFEQVQEGLSHVQDVVPLASEEVVSIEAVPGRMFDMLAKAQLHLGTTSGAKIPVGRHGEGTQSLSVLMLFAAFLKAWPEGAPIVALEEPEAHLHPSAIRALWQLVGDLGGQKLVSTHSGDFIAEVDVGDIRRLARTVHGLRSFRVPNDLLSSEEKRKFNYHVRHARGELLFARCWLLVEGETETWVFAAAARALGLNVHREGVRLVEYRQADVGLMAKVASALGIAWYCVGDDDAERSNTEPRVMANLGRARAEDRVAFPYPDIETHLLANGYDGVYQGHMPQQNLDRIVKSPDDPGFWGEYARHLPSRAKTRAAAEVAIEMERRGRLGVTEEIRRVLTIVVELARGERR